MSAKILQFPSFTNPTDDDLAILIRASIIYNKRRRHNEKDSDIVISVRK